MAESPVLGTLTRFLGGNDGRNVDKAIDRIEKQLDKFADHIEKANDSLAKFSVGRGPGTGGLTAQSQASTGNGGAVTFGAASGGYGGGVGPSGIWAPGSAGGPGGPATGGFAIDNGGQQTPPGTPNGGGAKVAGRVIGGAVAVAGAYAANHYSNQVIDQAVAYQATLGASGGYMGAYRAFFQNNYTAMSNSDAAAAAQIGATNFGFMPTSSQFGAMQASARSLSFIDPSLSQQSTYSAVAALRQPGAFNKLNMLGIKTVDQNGVTDPKSIANQILQRIPGARSIKSPEQMAAELYDPAGSIYQTLQNWVSYGYIPAKSLNAIRAAIRGILLAQIKGMSYTTFNKLSNEAAADPSGSAAEQLSAIGIGKTGVQSEKYLQGTGRNKEVETVEGFIAGLRTSNALLGKFNKVLSGILSIPGVGEAFGAGSGFTGGIGSSLGTLFHMSPLGQTVGMAQKGLSMLGGVVGGGMAPTMSRSTGISGAMGGGGIGGAGSNQSGKSGSGGGGPSGGSGSSGSAGLTFIPPRPGLESMSSEQDFGPRTIGQGYHTGIDLQGSVGDPIWASAGGKVIGAGWGASGDAGYGNTVLIDHGGGFSTMYAHMSTISVSSGAEVRQGQVIGTVGDTGSYAQGAHLHFELHINGKPVDPVPYLKGRRAPISPGSASGSSSSGAAAGASGSGAAMGSTGAFNNGSRYGSIGELAALGLGSAGIASAGMASSVGTGATGSAGTAAGAGQAGRPNLGNIAGGGSSSQNIALGKKMAAAYGWSGSQWQDLLTLWNHESGWRTNADNPTSSAYGIPQALTELHKMPPGYMTDPKVQIGWGLNYIKGRYGSPSGAWDFWQAHNWYDRGNMNVGQTGEHTVHKGEMIVDAFNASRIRENMTSRDYMSRGRGGDRKIVLQFDRGSVQITAATGSASEMRDAAGQFADYLAKDQRLRELLDA